MPRKIRHAFFSKPRETIGEGFRQRVLLNPRKQNDYGLGRSWLKKSVTDPVCLGSGAGANSELKNPGLFSFAGVRDDAVKKLVGFSFAGLNTSLVLVQLLVAD